ELFIGRTLCDLPTFVHSGRHDGVLRCTRDGRTQRSSLGHFSMCAYISAYAYIMSSERWTMNATPNVSWMRFCRLDRDVALRDREQQRKNYLQRIAWIDCRDDILTDWLLLRVQRIRRGSVLRLEDDVQDESVDELKSAVVQLLLSGSQHALGVFY